MRFRGKIIAEACSLALSDRQMTVDMGQLSSNRFHAAGEYGDPVGFDIHLQDCSTVVSQRVGISFMAYQIFTNRSCCRWKRRMMPQTESLSLYLMKAESW